MGGGQKACCSSTTRLSQSALQIAWLLGNGCKRMGKSNLPGGPVDRASGGCRDEGEMRCLGRVNGITLGYSGKSTRRKARRS